ncbi:MAG: hypothetical protein KatS3mg131_2400 [Candidatus Tectimicrobiota bacterium]|nr:MAG: hypothetical protein KatS3mg131_2400 [Candidatus Tectomicrobia bacterium]
MRVLRAAAELARFAVELADEPEEWRRGLMHRPALPPQGGMLFVFPEAAPRTFWMLNTLIPLDILFADATGRILNIHHHVPPCLPPRRCPTYPSAGAAKYVLEIAGGQARALGIAAGDTLQLDERLEHGTRR